MSKKGFTLIELLAVIIILAIVALIATPIVLNVVEDAKKSAGQSEANMILKGVIDYCQTEKMGFAKTNYCQSGETIKQNIDKIVNLGKVNKDSINITLDSNKNISNLTLNSNGKDFELNNGKMEIVDKTKPVEPTIPEPVSFETDSWATIQKAVKDGNTSKYNIGDTKTINLTASAITPKEGQEIKLETAVKVRIANKSTNECKPETEGFSQTACGFVVEFVDIITTYNMNPATPEYQYGTNKGGWPASDMYKLLNNETNSIYSVLPPDLQKVIIDTYTVSGHGLIAGESNFVSNNKLYLLSTREVYGKEGTSNTITNDTADKESDTRQLDYYKEKNVTTVSPSFKEAIKNYQGSSGYWWLRSAASRADSGFFRVGDGGDWSGDIARSASGVAPAFRIG